MTDSHDLWGDVASDFDLEYGYEENLDQTSVAVEQTVETTSESVVEQTVEDASVSKSPVDAIQILSGGEKMPPPLDEFVPDCEEMTLADFGDYLPEEQDPNVLVKGRWLERGGSAFVVSTAGTGKSVHGTQLSLCFAAGLPFSGLMPTKPLKIWTFQSEDSPTRVVIDREDITAGLTEQYPDVDWHEMQTRVKFLKFRGAVGAKFLSKLDEKLSRTPDEKKPDVIILNPFLAFIGGPITDGSYVTPFLRGGEINREETCGLQDILERHKVGVLIYHHTPKPPTAKELESWLKSPFPEYQGAGSSDITNWGRSFVTMMRDPSNSRRVFLTAGKNGNDLGWDAIGGAKRMYLAYSDEIGITGKGRHFWRELTSDELDEVKASSETKSSEPMDVEKAAHYWGEKIASEPRLQDIGANGLRDEIYSAIRKNNRSRGEARLIVDELIGNPSAYGLKVECAAKNKIVIKPLED